MTEAIQTPPRYRIKTPHNLSPRIQWLRDYYFQGVRQAWNNEFTAWTTGTPWDFQYEEINFYIVPETYAFFCTFRSAFKQTAQPVKLPPDFWSWSIPERKAWFNHEVLVHYLPQELLPGDLLAGARFNVMTSTCLTQAEAREYLRLVDGKKGTRAAIQWFHNHGYGNAGATGGHLIPDYPRVLREGWKSIHADLEARYAALPPAEQRGPRGAQLRAMRTAATTARDVAAGYAQRCAAQAVQETDPTRRAELDHPGVAGASTRPGACHFRGLGLRGGIACHPNRDARGALRDGPEYGGRAGPWPVPGHTALWGRGLRRSARRLGL